MKKGDKEMGIWGLIVVLTVVVSVFCGAVSAENVSEDLTESVAHASSSDLGDQAASLAEAVEGAPYLGDGYTWGGKGYMWNPNTGGWSGGYFVEPTEIENGYYYWNNKEGKVKWGKGLDCSGLTFWAYNKAAGKTKYIDSSNPIKEVGAKGQWNDNTRLNKINKGDLKRGDLLF